jgi:hypothetical protein
MIVVKVEMWPGGDESRAQEFARATITNQVKTTVQSAGKFGDYAVRLSAGIQGRPECMKRTRKAGTVTGFDRVRRGIWDLLFLALRNTVGNRNVYHGREEEVA